jgi:lipopolysaccharide export system permease protein
MSTISSYILRQTMAPLLMAVAVALLVLLTERMLRLLDLVLDTGGGLTVLLQMLAFLVPHYMALALPVAFFLGVLLAFQRLHQNNELDALGSAGVGLRRLVSPVLLLALALTVISAANFAVGQPYARYIYRALVHDVAEAAANVYLQERTFMEVDGITFMSERIWRRSQEFSGIFIYEEKPDGETTAVTARRGSLDVAPRGQQSTLFLQDGVRLESHGGDGGEVGGGDTRAGVLKFSEFHLPIDLVGQSGFRPRGEDERELTLTAVCGDIGIPPAVANALFVISRVPGIAAHAREEIERHKPMRQIDPKDHIYDGPYQRRLPERRKSGHGSTRATAQHGSTRFNTAAALRLISRQWVGCGMAVG